MNKRRRALVLLSLFCLLSAPARTEAASPWAAQPTYAGKTGGKLGFGLKNSLLGWTMMFVEAKQPEYKKDWEGFCVGISRSVFYTAAGLVQLVTFPVPVDFPDVGKGLHVPTPEKIAGGSRKFGLEPDASLPPETAPSAEADTLTLPAIP